jgi:hypothetical protein
MVNYGRVGKCIMRQSKRYCPRKLFFFVCVLRRFIARNIQVNQFARYFKDEVGSLECYAQYVVPFFFWQKFSPLNALFCMRGFRRAQKFHRKVGEE